MPAQAAKRATVTPLIRPNRGGYSDAPLVQTDVGSIDRALDIALRNLRKTSSPRRSRGSERKRKRTGGSTGHARKFVITLQSNMHTGRLARSIEDAMYMYFVEGRGMVAIRSVKVVLMEPVHK